MSVRFKNCDCKRWQQAVSKDAPAYLFKALAQGDFPFCPYCKAPLGKQTEAPLRDPEYVIRRHGYLDSAPDADRKAVEQDFMGELRVEAERCRARFGSAYTHKLGDMNYVITIGSDRYSSVWCSMCVCEV